MTDFSKTLTRKLARIRSEAADVMEQMESLIARIDKQGIEVGIGSELNTDLQKFITQFLTLRDVYQDISQSESQEE